MALATALLPGRESLTTGGISFRVRSVFVPENSLLQPPMATKRERPSDALGRSERITYSNSHQQTIKVGGGPDRIMSPLL